jgi:hypothetical protein
VDREALRWEQLAVALSGMGSLVARLLAQHRPDRHGRCLGCTRPGYGSPHRPSPCAIAQVAARADRIRRADPRKRGT